MLQFTTATKKESIVYMTLCIILGVSLCCMNSHSNETEVKLTLSHLRECFLKGAVTLLVHMQMKLN